MNAFSLQNPAKGAVLLGAALAGLLWLTIFQVNALTASVYRRGDQEQRLERLKEQSILLEAQRVPMLSRERMEELAQAMRFERVQSISYLKALKGQVAQNTKEQ